MHYFERKYTFLRKDDYDGTAFLVVTHLGREEQVQVNDYFFRRSTCEMMIWFLIAENN